MASPRVCSPRVTIPRFFHHRDSSKSPPNELQFATSASRIASTTPSSRSSTESCYASRSLDRNSLSDSAGKALEWLVETLKSRPEGSPDFIIIDCPAGIDAGFITAITPANEAVPT
ncbi:hypothetical protein Bca4012_041243 [Brassica carinata]|uniref:Uncharacterized protein n=1 Tax=Brassica carinata TaxID=52824 RepID=A0A8X7UH92_BRACI|nr:hypothetical protein Bca52824_060984 [Brassica carinata]